MPTPIDYPPVSFYFEAKIDGASGAQASFAEVSGLDAEREVFEIKEGGENRFTHRLPGRTKYSNLVLKRGIVWAGSPLYDWCKDVLETTLARPITPKDIIVSLLDTKGLPLMTWNVATAWPVKWQIAGFKAKDNEIAMETLEFAFAQMTRSHA